MNSNSESIPQVWDDARDEAFFRLTAPLFEPAFCYGASVLLATYDADDAGIRTREATITAQVVPNCVQAPSENLPVRLTRDSSRRVTPPPRKEINNGLHLRADRSRAHPRHARRRRPVSPDARRTDQPCPAPAETQEGPWTGTSHQGLVPSGTTWCGAGLRATRLSCVLDQPTGGAPGTYRAPQPRAQRRPRRQSAGRELSRQRVRSIGSTPSRSPCRTFPRDVRAGNPQRRESGRRRPLPGSFMG
jgi:hypothetical protein